MNFTQPALIGARRAYLRGAGRQLLERLAAGGRIKVNAYTSRDGVSACLLGHMALTPPLRRDGWHFVNGIPHWAGYMGVDAARVYFDLGWQQALDVFGTSRESRAESVAHRLSMLDDMLQCSKPSNQALSA